LRIHGVVPRTESLGHQRESQTLLLPGRNVPSDAGCYADKLFEYLASHRPLLTQGRLWGVTENCWRNPELAESHFLNADLLVLDPGLHQVSNQPRGSLQRPARSQRRIHVSGLPSRRSAFLSFRMLRANAMSWMRCLLRHHSQDFRSRRFIVFHPYASGQLSRRGCALPRARAA
jgi:hypothetical protein